MVKLPPLTWPPLPTKMEGCIPAMVMGCLDTEGCVASKLEVLGAAEVLATHGAAHSCGDGVGAGLGTSTGASVGLSVSVCAGKAPMLILLMTASPAVAPQDWRPHGGES